MGIFLFPVDKSERHTMAVKKNKIIRYITVTAIMAALSFVLMLLEFATPLTPVFLKFDFSDLPAFITAFSLGPFWGVTVELLKNVMHLPFSHTSCVGELANFIVGSCLVIPAGLIYQFVRSRKGALLGSLAGAFTAAVVSFPVNYFITYPFYSNFMSMDAIISAYNTIIPVADTLPKALLIVNVPFTFVKGIVCCAINFAIYKKISPLLKGDKKVKKEPASSSENPQ